MGDYQMNHWRMGGTIKDSGKRLVLLWTDNNIL